MKLKALFLAFLVLSGCEVSYDSSQEQVPTTSQEDPVGIPYNKTDIRGLREYCIKGVLYYGWLSASDGDWLAIAYNSDTGQIQKCLVSDPQEQLPITRY